MTDAGSGDLLHPRTFAGAVGRWADSDPERVAVVTADGPDGFGSDRSYAELMANASRFAADLAARGTARQAPVGVCVRNSAEFLEAYLGASLAAVVPFNINFRYTATEIRYLVDDCAAAAVVCGDEFVPAIVAALTANGDTAATVRTVYVVGAPVPATVTDRLGAVGVAVVPFPGAVVADEVAVEPARAARPDPDDLMYLYTGGTTGLPKATMWRQGEIVDAYGTTMTDLGAAFGGGPVRTMSAAPMMHGTGLISQLSTLFGGGTVIVGPLGRFDPAAVWSSVSHHRVNVLTIVGDPFARPLLAARRTDPALDLTALRVISSSGAMWSEGIKDGLHDTIAGVSLYDSFASSEAMGLGAAVTNRAGEAATAAFSLGPYARVLADDGTWVAPGSGIAGRIAVSAPLPVGYLGDPAKSASTFVVLDDMRYAIPGDYVLLHEEGRVTLLGRGSTCINTGGEKVYPEEIEEALKLDPAVADAACLGVPDERFGEVVGAMVARSPGSDLDAGELVAAVRERVAGYKVPRHLVVVDDLGRGPNGKLDRPALRRRLIERIERDRPPTSVLS